MATLATKRIYDKPARSDGYRVLVDRLWPRGIAKAKAGVDLWAKGAAPSSELRAWFHADPEARYSEFTKRYKTELATNAAAKTLRAELRKRKGAATLLTAAKEPEHSHVPVLKTFLRR